MSSLHWESHCIFNLLKFLKWVHHIIMPTLLDYLRVTQIRSQSPTLPYGWPELPDKRKFGSVAHKKLRFKLHMFQNSKLLVLVFQFLASFSCKMHVVHCKQLYKSLIGWVFNKLKSLTDRSTFSPWNCSVRGVQIKKKKFSRGVASTNSVGRGCWSKRKSPEIGISAFTFRFLYDYMRRQVVISILKKWISQKWKLFAIINVVID